VGNDSHNVFGKKNSLAKRKCETVHCRYVTVSSCRQSSGRIIRTFSQIRHKPSQWCAALTGLSGRIFYEQSIHLMSNKMVIMLLTLLFTCLAVFDLGEYDFLIQTPVYSTY
jgi:hypothetical protein